ncbi:MAG: HAMP domain-containing protein [Anaerolineae bacterium]|nr:HAMP domain-containing protein [Anaerolineae bacterium]
MFFGIRARLTLSHLLVIVLAMGLSGFLLLSFLERYFLQAMEDSLIAQARITAQALIPGATLAGPSIETQAPAYNTVQQQRVGKLSLQTQNIFPPTGNLPPDLSNLADASLELSTLLDTRIRVLNTQGMVVVDSQLAGQDQNLKNDPLVAQALLGQYASRTDSGQSNPAPAMYLALPVFVEGKLVGVVYLSQPLGDVTTVLHDLRLRWLVAMAIALLLSGLVGLLLSRAIANPLHQLTQAANAVAQGQLDQQVPVTSHDELGRLSQTFNQMTARLKAARQMQIDMVANVSHELRTPLTSIKGMIETLRGGAVDDPAVRDSFLETAEQETDRLIRLVKDLLLLSRVDSETLTLKKKPTNLAELIQKALDRLAFQIEMRGLKVQVDVNVFSPTVDVDPDRIEQVLMNLLDNSIKYSQSGGQIIINVAPKPNQLALIQIQDHGMGIAADDLPRIGQRFYRTDKARSRAEGGSGLGLVIARSLIRAHGGQLWIDSQEGQGTVVSFTLPCIIYQKNQR